MIRLETSSEKCQPSMPDPPSSPENKKCYRWSLICRLYIILPLLLCQKAVHIMQKTLLLGLLIAA